MKTSSLLISAFSLTTCLAVAEPITPSAREAFSHAYSERIAVVGIGDSNQRFGGHGWAQYMSRALAETFGCWGSELTWVTSTKEEVGENGPAPAALQDTAFTGWYLPAGKSEFISWKHGAINIPANHPMGVQGRLRFNLVYGNFPNTEGGTFSPSVRVDQPPWTVLETLPPILTGGTESTLQTASLELPADPERSVNLMFSACQIKEKVTGPFFAECMQAINEDKQSGIAYSTLYASGGKSLWDMLEYFRETLGEKKLTEYFRRIREPLNGSKRCIVMINSGLNDRNASHPSAGPQAGLPSSSPEGYRDNLLGVVDTLERAWIASGGKKEDVFFAFMPSHALQDSDEIKLAAFREEALSVSKTLPNAGCILIPELVPYTTMAEKLYYDQDRASDPHLARAGYEAISLAVAAALKSK